MIDTHSHIYLGDFEKDRVDMLSRAVAKGVERIYLPNIDVTTIGQLKDLAKTQDICLPMMGLHPGSVKADFELQLDIILAELKSNVHWYKAVGEIGMDLYWDKTFVEEQRSAFGRQIEVAKELGLPIVIHCRDAFDEIFAVLDQHKGPGLCGIFHCFTGNLDQAHRAISYGLKLGIGGIVTFKNAGLDKVVEQIDLEHLVLETDAPYLAPMPNRGKRNEPSFISFTAQKVADLKGVSLGELEEVTNKNAIAIFGE